MAASLGTKCRYGVGSTTATQFIEVIGDSLRLQRTILYNNAMVGSRSQPSERTREATRMVSGQIQMTPSPVELDTILPYILGGSESADSFPLAETLPTFHVTADRDGTIFYYGACNVNQATFSGSSGNMIELSLDIMGQDESTTSFPSISLDVASKPYLFADGVVSVGGTNYAVNQVSLSIDNMLEPQYFNSLTPSRFNPTGRNVRWDITLPAGDSTAIYGPSITGVAVVWTITNGNRSLTFTSNKVQFDKVTPTPSGRGEIFMTLSGTARKDGSTAELVTSSDSSG